MKFLIECVRVLAIMCIGCMAVNRVCEAALEPDEPAPRRRVVEVPYRAR